MRLAGPTENYRSNSRRSTGTSEELPALASPPFPYMRNGGGEGEGSVGGGTSAGGVPLGSSRGGGDGIGSGGITGSGICISINFVLLAPDQTGAVAMLLLRREPSA